MSASLRFGPKPPDLPGELLGLRVRRSEEWLVRRVTIARTTKEQVIGLLKHSHLDPGQGLLFPGCRSIHTFGMRFPIDVVMLDGAWRVVALSAALPAGRVILPVWKAAMTLELAASVFPKVGLRLGDELEPVWMA